MNDQKIDIQRIDHVVVLTIVNPPANTWDLESLTTLASLVDQFDQDNDIHALVITGRGQTFFSAGADLNPFINGDKKIAWDISQAFGKAFEALTRFRGVSIAAVNGYAMGGGLECALACDIRIAEEQAQFGLPEARVGLLPCAGGTQNLPWLVGEGWAKRMILLGERVDAATAERIGLVEEVVPRGESLTHALKLAENVSAQSPSSVDRCKRLIMNARTSPLVDGLEKERTLFLELFDLPDQKEGVNAFLEKRSPQWMKNQ